MSLCSVCGLPPQDHPDKLPCCPGCGDNRICSCGPDDDSSWRVHCQTCSWQVYINDGQPEPRFRAEREWSNREKSYLEKVLKSYLSDMKRYNDLLKKLEETIISGSDKDEILHCIRDGLKW